MQQLVDFDAGYGFFHWVIMETVGLSPQSLFFFPRLDLPGGVTPLCAVGPA